MGTAGVQQFVPFGIADERIIKNLADFLRSFYFQELCSSGSASKADHQILVWNRNPCILFKVLKVVQELFFCLKGLDQTCFVLLYAPGKALLKLLKGGLVGILDDGFLCYSGHEL